MRDIEIRYMRYEGKGMQRMKKMKMVKTRLLLLSVFVLAFACTAMTMAAAEATEPVVYTRVYKDYVSAPQIPDELEFAAGEEMLTGRRTQTEKEISDTYDVPFAIRGKFYGDEDSLYYRLAGRLVPAAEVLDYEAYQQELLASLGLDAGLYRIDDAKWISNFYSQEEKTVRDALFTGMQRSTTYTVRYEAD